MVLQDLLRVEHLDRAERALGRSISCRLCEEVLYFIDKNVDETSKTLETGIGVSTILFALKGAHHTCVTPHQ
ncbi:unnamed protein product, partial [marine sediment metagenome]